MLVGVSGPHIGPGESIGRWTMLPREYERRARCSALRGPRWDLGLKEEERYPTYRGTEEVVYLSFGDEWLGLRPADGGTHRYYGVGLEHLAFEADARKEVDAAHQRCSRRGDRIHHPPEEDRDIPGYYAFFVFDPDGLRIEVFSPGPEWSSRMHRSS